MVPSSPAPTRARGWRYTVGANGFFEVTADSAKTSYGYWVANRWRVFLRDDYFRGGDKLVYYWQATDAAGGKASYPPGISGTPSSVAQAEQLTGGLLEVSYLPTIDWDAGYLARVAADPEGDVAPTAAEVAGSSQRNCILYNQHTNSARHSGETNRTAFMYALDRLGYRGCYDVYDHTGYGNTNNQLGGRATNAQCGGYALIIEDDGRSSLMPNMTDGSNLDDSEDQPGAVVPGLSGAGPHGPGRHGIAVDPRREHRVRETNQPALHDRYGALDDRQRSEVWP